MPAAKSPAKHRRGYRACTACRTSRVKCDLGNPDFPDDPPCRRCARSGRRCVLVGSFGLKNDIEEKQDPRPFADTSESGSNALVPVATATKAPVPAAEDSSYAFLENSEPHTELFNASSSRLQLDDSALASDTGLANPSDAVRILAATATGRTGAESSSRPILPKRTHEWEDWIPVREGLISASEAGMLYQTYFTFFHPRYPLLPIQLLEPSQISHLIEREPLLLGAIICIAARYTHLTDRRSGAGQFVYTHGNVFKWVMQRVGYLACGESSLQSVASVEGLLLLAEWPPLSQFLSDTSAQAFQETNRQDLLRSSQLYDNYSWNLIGIAVRTAQNLSLHKEDTYNRLDDSEQAIWSARRRFVAWNFCHEADRHVSVRLGREAMVQPKMSSRWWDIITQQQKQPGNNSFPFPRAQHDFAENRAYAELTHTIGVMQEALYSTPEATSELLRTGGIDPLLRRLKPELDSLWAWHREAAAKDELGLLRFRLEFDYVRLYSNAISIRAAQHRVFRRLMNSPHADQAIFGFNVIRSTEAPFILEAIDSARSLLQDCLRMHELGVLIFSPTRVFLRMTFASVFLVKALTIGALRTIETDVIDLLSQIHSVMTQITVDPDHMCARLAGLLQLLLRTTIPTNTHSHHSQQASASTRTDSVATPQTLSDAEPIWHTGLTPGPTGFESTNAIPIPQQDLSMLAANIGATSSEQDQLLYAFCGGDKGDSNESHLLSTLWNHDIFDELNDFLGLTANTTSAELQ